MSTSSTVELSQSILTHKGETKTIELKEPTAKSFIDHGEPFKVSVRDGAVNVDFNNKPMAAFLADMTGIDPVLLSGLMARDFLTLRSKAVDLIMGLTGSDDPVPTSAD